MANLKQCPDLTTKEWHKAIMVGTGDFQKINLHSCIEEFCAAYKDGKCMKYGTDVLYKEGEQDGSK